MITKPKTYKTAEEFNNAVENYIDSISSTKSITDLNGNSVLNDKGEIMTKRVFIEPPSVLGMCLYLGINRSTLKNYKDTDNEIYNTYMRVKEIFEKWTWDEIQTREKNVEGLKFSLIHNYDYKDSKDINLNANMVVDNVTALSLEDKIKALEGLRQLADGSL